jgi:hypothetical protein
MMGGFARPGMYILACGLAFKGKDFFLLGDLGYILWDTFPTYFFLLCSRLCGS